MTLEEIEKLEAQKRRLEKDIATLSSKRDNLVSAIADYQQTEKQVKASLEQIEERQGDLSTNLKANRQKLLEVKSLYEASKEAYSYSLQEEVETLLDEIAELKEAKDQEAISSRDYEAQLRARELWVADKLTEIDQSQDQIEAEKASLKAQKGKLSALLGQLTAWEKEITHQAQELQVYEAHVKSLTKALEAKGKRLSSRQRRFEKLASKIGQSLTHRQQTIRAVAEALSRQKQAYLSMEQSLQIKQAQVNDQRIMVNTAWKELTVLKKHE